ncbi:MAG: ATP-grasp domain-containing protein [Deferribacteraceae bacterium]|jgi:D-alanine-D-alanine ligase|nr:ATP-grasp domain-containing protein [Deferribacteraceae bacterium]
MNSTSEGRKIVSEARKISVGICYEPPAAGSGADMQDILTQAAFLQQHIPYPTKLVTYTGDVPAFLHNLKGIDIAWNLFESFNGLEEQQYLGAALLELAKIPYTGTKANVLSFCADKRIVRAILAARGIKVPQGYILGELINPPQDSRWILKPAKLHGSVGIGDASIVTGVELATTVWTINKNDPSLDIFAEEYIDGDEYSVTLLHTADGFTAIAVAQMQFINYPPDKPRILGYEAKWNEDSADYAQTVRSFEVDKALARKLATIAEDAARALELSGFARIDFRVSADGTAYVIDVNPNPGLGEDSGFVAACVHSGRSIGESLAAIIDAGAEAPK